MLYRLSYAGNNREQGMMNDEFIEDSEFIIHHSSFLSGQGRIRTTEGVCQLIYSQPRLAAWVPALVLLLTSAPASVF